MHRLSALIPADDFARFAEHCRQNDRTIAQEVRRMVRMYLAAVCRGEPADVESAI